jgi:hypothetical protein
MDMTRCLSALVVLALLTGCSSTVGPRFTQRSDVTMPCDPSPPLDARVRAGDLTILPHDAQQVRVDAVFKSPHVERVQEAELRVREQSDGTIVVDVRWPGDTRRDNESASLTIHMPQANGVTLQTGSGDVDVKGMGGPLVARTGSGDVELQGHAGSIEVMTGSGDVEATDIAGEARARTGSGDTTLHRVGQYVDVRTGSGDVDVSLLPQASGPVVIRTGSGDVDVRIGEGMRGEMAMSAGSGDVSLGTMPAGLQWQMMSQGNRWMVLRFGGSEEPASSIDTGSGDIRVQRLP